jgi:hypothetical protein
MKSKRDYSYMKGDNNPSRRPEVREDNIKRELNCNFLRVEDLLII